MTVPGSASSRSSAYGISPSVAPLVLYNKGCSHLVCPSCVRNHFTLVGMCLKIGCLCFGRQHGVLTRGSVPPRVQCAAWLRGTVASHSTPWLEATESRVTGWQQPPKPLLKANPSARCALPFLQRRKNEALPSSVAETGQEPSEI